MLEHLHPSFAADAIADTAEFFELLPGDFFQGIRAEKMFYKLMHVRAIIELLPVRKELVKNVVRHTAEYRRQ